MRLRGALLFLFIPLVLVLFLRQPLGILPSLFLGIAIMVGHRFVAAPFSARHRTCRCLWCGRGASGENLTVVSAPGVDRGQFALCRREERDCGDRWDRLHRFALRNGRLIRFGIGVPLVHYLVAELVRGFHGSAWVTPETNRLIFQVGIALTVVGISIFYRTAGDADSVEANRSAGLDRPPLGDRTAPKERPAGGGRSAPKERPAAGDRPALKERPAVGDRLAGSKLPFPIHNLTLLGAGWTLHIFRVVGIWWILSSMISVF